RPRHAGRRPALRAARRGLSGDLRRRNLDLRGRRAHRRDARSSGARRPGVGRQERPSRKRARRSAGRAGSRTPPSTTSQGEVMNHVCHRFCYRVGIVAALTLTPLAGPVAVCAQTQPDMRVTLLGIGTPVPIVDRFGPSTLIEAGAEKLVFDCGRGCPIRLQQKSVRLGEVKLFVTHLHSDHVNGIVDLWLTGWLAAPCCRPTTPFVMIGPEGTENMAAHLEAAFMPDIRIRMADEKLPREGVRFDAKDITPGIAYEANGVTVTAFEVDHGDEIKPAYGYRINYRGRSV